MPKNKPLTKVNTKCPLHLKNVYVLALLWEIQSV